MTAPSRIEAVEICVARVPLDPPVYFSTSHITGREYCLVRVRSADGHHGIGFTYGRDDAGELLASAGRYLGARILGRIRCGSKGSGATSIGRA